MPPPTVNGMKTSSATLATMSTVVLRRSELAVMSRKISSSAPSTSWRRRELDRVAGVAQIHEVGPLDHPTGVDVETGNDTGDVHDPTAAIASDNVKAPS